MSLFQKAVAAAEPEITGTEAIRARVWSRWKRANLARTAMDLSLSLPALEAFAVPTIWLLCVRPAPSWRARSLWSPWCRLV